MTVRAPVGAWRQLDHAQLRVYGGGSVSRNGAQKGAMKQLCDDLRQFAVQVRQIGFSLNGGAGEWECLDLSERMLAAVKQAETRMVR